MSRREYAADKVASWQQDNWFAKRQSNIGKRSQKFPTTSIYCACKCSIILALH